jgi:hypothetical protein
MRHKNVCVGLAPSALLVGALTVAWPATAQDLQSSIVGLWKVTSVTTQIVSTGEMVHPFGERPSGYEIFTRGGHVMFSMFGENRATSDRPVPDVDRVALYNALVAYSGTYKIENSKLLIHFEASATPGTADRAYVAEISGNKLTLTSDPFTSGLTGRRIITIRTFDRIE